MAKIQSKSIRVEELNVDLKIQPSNSLQGIQQNQIPDFVEVTIRVGSRSAITIELDRLTNRGEKSNAFQTHSNLENSRFENRGLGTLAYLVAARLAFILWGADVYSTIKPDEDTALPLWRRLVDAGIADHNADPYDSRVDRFPVRKRFHIINEVLNSVDPDFIDVMISNILDSRRSLPR